MKIAGRKNAGAWFRMNKAIKEMTAEDVGFLTTVIGNLDGIDAAFSAIDTMASQIGFAHADKPSSSSEWAVYMANNGIPLQIWMGNLSYATYTRSGTTGAYEYAKDGEAAIRVFGKQLRKAVTKFVFGRRAIRDAFNFGLRSEGNVGGYPNATEGDL